MTPRSPLPPATIRRGAPLAALALLLALLAIAPAAATQPVAATPTGFITVPVQVPASMRTGVFASDRTLTVPAGFAIAVYARVAGARFLAVAPDGTLLVSQPSTGTVLRLRPDGTAEPLFGGLHSPHDLVFHRDRAATWLYVAETDRVSRAAYAADGTVGQLQPLVTGLPDSSLPELGGTYGHELKNLAIGPDGALYVSIASTCNACVEDTVADPVRGAIYRYDADGGNRRLYARGIRNAEGLAFAPDTGDLWAVVNNRDGLGDDFPAEPFIRVRDGGNYGWPYCNPDPTTGATPLPYRNDPDHNADGHVDCGAMTPVDGGIQAHSAPLGLTFLGGTAVPAPWRDGVVAGLHGSWNRTRKTGFAFAWFPWADGAPGARVDLVAGWLDEATQEAWGRPVDSAVAADGALFLSDDASGTIYRLAAAAAEPSTSPAPGASPAPGTPVGPYTVTARVTGGGAVEPAGTQHFAAGTVATYRAVPAEAGQLFTGWTVDGAYAGHAATLAFTVDTDHAVVATFVPRPSFNDVPGDNTDREAIGQLAARGIVLGYGDGRFGPDDPALRAEVAALIARAMPGDPASGPGVGPATWATEERGTAFTDQGVVDDPLWRDVGTLAYYDVARGYADGTYDPTGTVGHAQAISLIARAMVAKGYWAPQPVDPARLPGLPADSGHQQDLATFVHYAGAIPTATAGVAWDGPAGWDQPAGRGWVAEVLWLALDGQFGSDRVP